jgi:hypothetical protein
MVKILEEHGILKKFSGVNVIQQGFVLYRVQGGSDISGTLSKLQSPLKNHLFK